VLVPVLRALLTALQGGSVTLRRCDVAVAGEAADAAGAADVLLHAGGVLQVTVTCEHKSSVWPSGPSSVSNSTIATVFMCTLRLKLQRQLADIINDIGP
jgi:hypothetical protein